MFWIFRRLKRTRLFFLSIGNVSIQHISLENKNEIVPDLGTNPNSVFQVKILRCCVQVYLVADKALRDIFYIFSVHSQTNISFIDDPTGQESGRVLPRQRSLQTVTDRQISNITTLKNQVHILEFEQRTVFPQVSLPRKFLNFKVHLHSSKKFRVTYTYTYFGTSSIPSQSTICSTEKFVRGFPIMAHCPSMLPMALNFQKKIEFNFLYSF